MSKSKGYTGIDYFRFIAALLVIAIHTSPLMTYTETGDFILTRIIARVAVPFFFMTTGFFLVSEHSRNADRLKSFVKKTALIYGVSIILYLPLNVYTGYFSMDYLLPNIIKDVLFDGTMYHLWYLPAAIIGGALAWYLVREKGFTKAFVISAVLYAFGLLGDSYYGLTERIPVLNAAYQQLFELSDYTRNGIFYAPIFFVLGGYIAAQAKTVNVPKNLVGFAVSFLLMFGEGMLLHKLGFQRHDSMYIFLIPSMYFLFCALTAWRGPRHELLKTSTLVMYIIHPMVIVGVRMVAKVIGMEALLIENSVGHYVAVSVITIICSVLFTVVYQKFTGKKKNDFRPEQERAWIEVDIDNLKHNVDAFNQAMPDNCELMGVVKANAYGHGAYEIASSLSDMGVKSFAVATINEAIALRRTGIKGEILILGYTDPARAKDLHKYDLMQNIVGYEYAVALNEQGYKVKGHIKIDTGMHRLGFNPEEIDKVQAVFHMNHIKVCGIFSHLCVSDSLTEDDVQFTKKQIDTFYGVIDALKQRNVTIPKVHIQASYGLLNYPELQCDYVRMGIALYGVLSTSTDRTKLNLDLRPVLSLKTKVVLTRTIKAGDSVSYGRKFVAQRESKIAVLPIGYADGFPRNLSCGKTYALINGQKAPIIGRICMDQMAVDVTDIPDVQVGMVATLIGKDGDQEITAPMVAEQSTSITNELLSRMGQRLGVVITSNKS